MSDHSTKPTTDDIVLAIRNIAAGNWIDPSIVPNYWDCKLYGPNGRRGEGQALTPEQAMAMAWIHVHHPDALCAGSVDLDRVPLEVGHGWRFELTPPRFSVDDLEVLVEQLEQRQAELLA